MNIWHITSSAMLTRTKGNNLGNMGIDCLKQARIDVWYIISALRNAALLPMSKYDVGLLVVLARQNKKVVKNNLTTKPT